MMGFLELQTPTVAKKLFWRRPSTSEVTSLWHYTNLFTVIIIILSNGKNRTQVQLQDLNMGNNYITCNNNNNNP